MRWNTVYADLSNAMPAASSIPVVTLLVMAGTWAFLIAAIRWPMASPPPLAAAAVFLLSGAVMLAWRETSLRVLDGRWSTYALALASILAVLFSPTTLLVLGAGAGVVLYVLLGVIWIAGLRGLLHDCRREPRWHVAAAVGGGIALGLLYFLYVNTKGYGTVFSPEQTLLGTQHRDTLYHASIAAMLGNYAVPSTGLDGVVPIKYHFLSHALIGSIARWTGVAPLHAYYVTHQILNLPLLLFSLTAAAFWVWRPERGASGLLAFLVPFSLLQIFEMWEWGTYLVSESYALSLVLLLLALPLVIELHDRPHVRHTLTRYVTLALVGFAILLAKNSVGVLFAGAVLFAALRMHPFLPWRLAAYVAAGASVVGLGMLLTAAPGYGGQSLIGPLHFFRTYPDSAWPNTWFILVGLAAAVWVRSSGEARLMRNSELLGVIAIASLALGLLLQIGSGAAYYFMNVGVWVSIVMVAGGFLLPRLARLPRRGVVAGAVMVAISLAILAVPEKRRAGPNLVALAVGIDAALQGAPSTRAHPSLLEFMSPNDSIRRRIAQAVRATPRGQMHQRLLEVRAAARAVDAVYVPPANEAFWNWSTIVCTATPFVVPALSSLPMILGLPPDRERCPLPPDTGYGYGAYEETSRSVPLSDAELCVALRRRDFATALVLEKSDSARTVICP